MRGVLPQVGVMPVTWSKFAPTLTNGHDVPLLRDILAQINIHNAVQEITSTQTGQPELLTQLYNGKPAQQRVLLTQFVSGHAHKVLGLKSNSAINERKPLSELGLDSLMAVELRNLLSSGLGLKRSLPATLVFDYPTIEVIVEYLMHDVLSLNASVENEPVPTAENPLDTIEDLSDDEIDRLLQARMNRQNE